jgi:hypothetical protein
MDTSEIQLIVVEESEVEQKSSESSMAREFRTVTVPSSFTPNDIIEKKLKVSLEVKKRVPIPNARGLMRKQCTLVTSHSLECPSLGGGLDDDAPIDQQGIVANTVLVLGKREWYVYDRPRDDPWYDAVFSMGQVRGIRHFNELVRTKLEEIGESQVWEPLLFAALLYTDEDIELAKYIRLNGRSLSEMSGDNFHIIVIERPPKLSLAETIAYWKETLAFEAYVFWGGNGWTRTKPYDKAAAYEIARNLGVFPSQMPCIAFFEHLEDEDKVVVPIRGDFPLFFRQLFGALQGETTSHNDIARYYWLSESKKHLKDLSALVMSQGRIAAFNEGSVTYIFNGQTVFINKPSGHIEIKDFQK